MEILQWMENWIEHYRIIWARSLNIKFLILYFADILQFLQNCISLFENDSKSLPQYVLNPYRTWKTKNIVKNIRKTGKFPKKNLQKRTDFSCVNKNSYWSSENFFDCCCFACMECLISSSCLFRFYMEHIIRIANHTITEWSPGKTKDIC